MIAARPVTFSGAEENRLAGDIWDGGGHPVVFLHGGGQTRRAWDATARRIAEKGMRAIAVDQRGHGESEWVVSGNYSFSAFAEDAAAVAGQVSAMFHAVPSAVGASLGGIAALTAEIHHAPLLETLTLVDVTPRMDRTGVEKVQGFMGERLEDGFGSLEEAADVIAAYLPHRKRPSSARGLAKNLRRGTDGRYRWHWDPAFMRGASNINSGAEALLEHLMTRLSTLRPPVLLVRGMDSEIVRESFAREFVDLVPDASFVDVGGAGHMVAGDRNDAFSSAILDFLSHRKAA